MMEGTFAIVENVVVLWLGDCESLHFKSCSSDDLRLAAVTGAAFIHLKLSYQYIASAGVT